MLIKKLLSASVLTGLVLLGGLAPAPAATKTGETLYTPQGGWSLSKIDRVAKNGNSYCTLSRKYNDNVVLSLGRNMAEEYSLAIDFQKPVFTKDDSLKIMLSSASGQSRNFDLMPASEKALVVRLGWDSAFIKALNQSKTINVSIDGRHYTFPVPDIQKGDADLKGCMDELKTASSAGGAVKKEERSATKDVLLADSSLNSTNSFSAQKADGAIKINSDEGAPVSSSAVTKKTWSKNEVKPSVSAPTNPVTASQQQAKSGDAAKQIEDLKKQLQEQMASADRERAERQALEKKLATNVAQKSSSDAMQAKITALQNEVLEKNKGLETLKQKTENVAATDRDVKALQAQIESLQKTIAVQKNEIAVAKAPMKIEKNAVTPDPDVLARAADLKKVQDENKSLKEKMEKLERSLIEKTAMASTAAVTPLPGMDVELKKAQQKLATLEAENSDLKGRNKQLDDMVRVSQTRIAETALNTETRSIQRIAELETKLNAATKDNLALAKQLDGLKLGQEDKVLKAFAGDVTLEKAMKRYNEAEREIQRLGLQLEKQQGSCNIEKAQIENMLFDPAVTEQKQIEKLVSLQDEVAKLRSAQSSGGDVAALRTQISNLQAENAALKTQVQTASMAKTQEAGRADQMAAIRLEMEDLRKQLALKDQQNAAYQSQITSMKNDKTLLNLQAENTALKTQVQSASVAKTQEAGRVDQMAAIRLEMEDLRKQLALKDKLNATYQNQIATMQHDAKKNANVASASVSPRASQKAPVSDVYPGLSGIPTAAGVYSDVRNTSVSSINSGKDFIQSVLSKSGIPAKALSQSASAKGQRYSWSQDGNLKGEGWSVPVAGQSFDGFIKDYIAKEQRACSGDFASMPSPSYGSAAKQMSLYEIACVAGGQNMASSLLFYEQNGSFYAMATSADAADMDLAMDSRDRMAQAVRGM